MVYGFVSVLLFAFTFYCLLDVVLSDEHEIRNLPKLVWVLLVVLLWGLGGMVWLLAGRPLRSSAAPGGRTAGAPSGGIPPRRPRPGQHPAGRGRPVPPPSAAAPRGPDDDPEFLRRLDERLRGGEDE